MSMITLVTGGARSGKSRFAQELAMNQDRRAFIATAAPIDDEMAARIEQHRADRGDHFHTIEETTDLAAAVAGLPPDTDVAVIDCLTVWLGNLLHLHGTGTEEYREVTAFLEMLPSVTSDLIIVTNEVGMGIVPDTELSRVYRDMAGRLNADVARVADNVTLLVSGIPITVKESE